VVNELFEKQPQRLPTDVSRSSGKSMVQSLAN